jgi:ABC-type spermidine/putrescine transport system permease subunit II
MKTVVVKSAVLAVISTFVGLLLGFGLSFVVSPDPTGILPLLLGVALTGILIPVFYFGIQRLFAPNKNPK